MNNRCRVEADFLVRLAQRRFFEGLPFVHAAAGQRHLAGVVAKGGAAHGQRDMKPAVVRVDQQQHRALTRARREFLRFPPEPGLGRHAELRVEARQRPRQLPEARWFVGT